jgi:predicted N-formylglutamate amidohydrolase
MFEVEPSNAPRSAAVRSPDRPAADPWQAVEVCHAEGRAPVLIVCDHAGRRIPERLGDLGLPESELSRHIAYDIGAADVTRVLARLLDAPAVLCHVSRLVIDPNRQPGDPTSIPKVSDGTMIPGNRAVDADEARRRLRLSFIPYHRQIARQIARLRRRVGVPAIVSVHSLTPVMSGVYRPWEIAVLWNRDARLARPVLDALSAQKDLCVGDNVPYSGRFPVGYSIPFHADRPGLPHVSFEIRQDLIDTPEKAAGWAERVADVLRAPLADSTLYRRIAQEDAVPCP